MEKEEILREVSAALPDKVKAYYGEGLDPVIWIYYQAHNDCARCIHLIQYHYQWIIDMQLCSLHANHCKAEIERAGIVFYPPSKHKPIILFKARKNNKEIPFFQILQYVCFLIKQCGPLHDPMKEKILLIGDMSDFSRGKADPRTLKLIVEFIMCHFPNIFSHAYMVNANMMYYIMFKAISPFLPPFIKGLVSVHRSPSAIPEKYLPGYRSLVEDEQYTAKLFDLTEEELPCTYPPYLLHCYEHIPFDAYVHEALWSGTLCKEGGWLPKNNVRKVCIMDSGIMVYYKLDEAHYRHEGFLDLRGCQVELSKQKLIIHCIVGNPIAAFTAKSPATLAEANRAILQVATLSPY